jgi:hypothetical protein
MSTYPASVRVRRAVSSLARCSPNGGGAVSSAWPDNGIGDSASEDSIDPYGEAAGADAIRWRFVKKRNLEIDGWVFADPKTFAG